MRNKSNLSTLDLNQIRAEIPSQLLRNRPNIRQAELELLASKYDIKSAKAAFYPAFVITGNIGYKAFNTALLFQSPESFAYSI